MQQCKRYLRPSDAVEMLSRIDESSIVHSLDGPFGDSRDFYQNSRAQNNSPSYLCKHKWRRRMYRVGFPGSFIGPTKGWKLRQWEIATTYSGVPPEIIAQILKVRLAAVDFDQVPFRSVVPLG
jgi:hypothetical protein